MNVATKAGLTIVAVLMLFATSGAAAKPCLFDLSLKGIVIKQNLASSKANLPERNLQGIDAGRHAGQKKEQRTLALAPRALPKAPPTNQPSAIGLGPRGAF